MVKFLITLLIIINFNAAIADKIAVFGNGNLPPMCYQENGKTVGFGYEIAKAVLDDAKIEYEFVLTPWNRAYDNAQHSEGIIFGMYWTSERDKIFDYTDVLWSEKVVLVTKKDNGFEFDSMFDLKDKVISFQRGSRPGNEFMEALNDKLFVSYPTNEPARRIRLVHANRVDAGIFNPGKASVVWHAKKANFNINDFTILERPLSVEGKHFGVAKSLKRLDLIDKLNRSIRKLKQDDVLRKIEEKYE